MPATSLSSGDGSVGRSHVPWQHSLRTSGPHILEASVSNHHGQHVGTCYSPLGIPRRAENTTKVSVDWWQSWKQIPRSLSSGPMLRPVHVSIQKPQGQWAEQAWCNQLSNSERNPALGEGTNNALSSLFWDSIAQGQVLGTCGLGS